MGYDAEGKVIRACSFGAPHQRQRVFIVGYPEGLLGEETLFPADKDSNDLGDYFRPVDSVNWNGVRFDGTAEGAVKSYKASLGTPVLFGVDDGVPAWLDRNTRLGNTVIPQITQYIGQCILDCERRVSA
jgi:site-specific DNA-cytosine methylase